MSSFSIQTWAQSRIQAQVVPLLPDGQSGWPKFEVALRSAVLREPKLADAIANNPQAAMLSVIKCAQLGLSLNPADEHYCLIPYKGVAQGQVMVRGWLHLMRQSGEVRDIEADVVYRQEMPEDSRSLRRPDGGVAHEPHVFERDSYSDSDIVGAYASVRLKDSDRWKTVFIGRDRIEKLRKMGAGNTPSWKDHYARMCVVKALKALARSGQVPLSPKAQLASADDEEATGVTYEAAPAASHARPPAGRSKMLPDEWDAGAKHRFTEIDKNPMPTDEESDDIEREALVRVMAELGTSAAQLDDVVRRLFKRSIEIQEMTAVEARDCANYLVEQERG